MTSALMIIDAQRNMLEPPEPIPDAANIRQRLQQLLASARTAGAVIIHVQNDGGADDPDRPGTAGWDLVFAPLPSETVVRKSSPDVFESNPALAGRLRERQISKLVVAGMQSEWCIAASVRGAAKAGFDIDLVQDAHATYDGPNDTADYIASGINRDLRHEGVGLVSTANATFN